MAKKSFAVKCMVCGKVTAGRLPRYAREVGDTTFWFPRRHKVNGVDCEGNIEEGELVDLLFPDPKQGVLGAPFKRGDLVICSLKHMTVNEGDKLRVIRCDPGECQSGWLVSATKSIHGPMPEKPTIAAEGIDASWFVSVKS